jgi:hypothetical protein
LYFIEQENKEHILGAIVVSSNSKKFVSNAEGIVRLNVRKPDFPIEGKLEASGFEAQPFNIKLSNSANPFKVALFPKETTMNSVIVSASRQEHK